MDLIHIQILNAHREVLSQKEGDKEVHLVYCGVYKEGDVIQIEFTKIPGFYWISLDEAREKSLSYVTGNVEYIIPFGEKKSNISPKVFAGEKHLLSVRQAYDFEVDSYRNLAFQAWDQHGMTTLFPHASANVETRDESVFAASNAIDGCTVSSSHGEWPYQSWGINQDPDAELVIEFGRKIVTDRIILYTRADYPHDNWWKNVTVEFSDQSNMMLDLIKTGKAQEFTFEKKCIQWIKLKKLIKAEDPSPFPALTQIEVYGKENPGGER